MCYLNKNTKSKLMFSADKISPKINMEKLRI